MVKSETHREAETLFKNLRLYCKKLKNPRLEETRNNETSRLNETSQIEWKVSETGSFLGTITICQPLQVTSKEVWDSKVSVKF